MTIGTAFIVGFAVGAGGVLAFLCFCLMLDKEPNDEEMVYINRLKAEVRDAQNECQWLHDQLDAALLENARLREEEVE